MTFPGPWPGRELGRAFSRPVNLAQTFEKEPRKPMGVNENRSTPFFLVSANQSRVPE